MPRRGNVPKRDVLPDPVYGSKVVAKLINQIMLDGNKATAQKIVYDAFDMMKEKLGKEPMEIFNQAMANVMPVLEVKARRVGGANYQVPIEIRPERRQTLAIRWIVINTRKRSEREMSKKLAAELMDAFNNTGGSVKKKEDTHRMAEANKAFAHFRWWRTSTPVRRPRPSVSCSTRAKRTSSARCTRAPLPWTGWFRSRSAG